MSGRIMHWLITLFLGLPPDAPYRLWLIIVLTSLSVLLHTMLHGLKSAVSEAASQFEIGKWSGKELGWVSFSVRW